MGDKSVAEAKFPGEYLHGQPLVNDLLEVVVSLDVVSASESLDFPTTHKFFAISLNATGARRERWNRRYFCFNILGKVESSNRGSFKNDQADLLSLVMYTITQRLISIQRISLL
jgi:hypothetical protein